MVSYVGLQCIHFVQNMVLIVFCSQHIHVSDILISVFKMFQSVASVYELYCNMRGGKIHIPQVNYTCTCVCVYIYIYLLYLYMCVCMYIYVCMYVCIYICIYIYMYVYIKVTSLLINMVLL